MVTRVAPKVSGGEVPHILSSPSVGSCPGIHAGRGGRRRGGRPGLSRSRRPGRKRSCPPSRGSCPAFPQPRGRGGPSEGHAIRPRIPDGKTRGEAIRRQVSPTGESPVATSTLRSFSMIRDIQAASAGGLRQAVPWRCCS